LAHLRWLFPQGLSSGIGIAFDGEDGTPFFILLERRKNENHHKANPNAHGTANSFLRPPLEMSRGDC